jgi:hypothetical protein
VIEARSLVAEISDYIPYLKLGEQGFAEHHSDAVLLHVPEEAVGDGRSFNTRVVSAIESARLELANPEQLAVTPLRKSTGVFTDRISIGRTKTSDLCFVYPRLSKFHAYFTWNEARTDYFLTDAESTNGTFIGGKRLPPKVPVQLPDGAVLGFAHYLFRFHLPRGFYRALSALRQTT